MQRGYQIYFVLLGAAALVSGALEILAAAAGHAFACPVVAFAPAAFRGLWGGLVMVFAGVFLLSGIRDFGEVHRLARLVMGHILLWIMAATDLFGLLAAAVPSPDPARWFNTCAGFLAALSPPYTPAMALLPLTFAIIPCLHQYRPKVS